MARWPWLRAQLALLGPGLGGFLIFAVLGLLLYSAGNPHAPNPQPVAFNHAKHVEMGMVCTDCHVGASDQARATLPTLETCMLCHEMALTENPEEEKLRAIAAAGGELAWNQLARVPPHVYFSHRRHVALGGLECAQCHGAMETRTEPPEELFRPLTMDACIACHEQRKVDNDCNRCHR